MSTRWMPSLQEASGARRWAGRATGPQHPPAAAGGYVDNVGQPFAGIAVSATNFASTVSATMASSTPRHQMQHHPAGHTHPGHGVGFNAVSYYPQQQPGRAQSWSVPPQSDSGATAPALLAALPAPEARAAPWRGAAASKPAVVARVGTGVGMPQTAGARWSAPHGHPGPRRTPRSAMGGLVHDMSTLSKIPYNQWARHGYTGGRFVPASALGPGASGPHGTEAARYIPTYFRGELIPLESLSFTAEIASMPPQPTRKQADTQTPRPAMGGLVHDMSTLSKIPYNQWARHGYTGGRFVPASALGPGASGPHGTEAARYIPTYFRGELIPLESLSFAAETAQPIHAHSSWQHVLQPSRYEPLPPGATAGQMWVREPGGHGRGFGGAHAYPGRSDWAVAGPRDGAGGFGGHGLKASQYAQAPGISEPGPAWQWPQPGQAWPGDVGDPAWHGREPPAAPHPGAGWQGGGESPSLGVGLPGTICCRCGGVGCADCRLRGLLPRRPDGQTRHLPGATGIPMARTAPVIPTEAAPALSSPPALRSGPSRPTVPLGDQRARRRRRSKVWAHFDIVDQLTSICRYCNERVAGSSDRTRRHLRSCAAVPEAVLMDLALKRTGTRPQRDEVHHFTRTSSASPFLCNYCRGPCPARCGMDVLRRHLASCTAAPSAVQEQMEQAAKPSNHPVWQLTVWIGKPPLAKLACKFCLVPHRGSTDKVKRHLLKCKRAPAEVRAGVRRGDYNVYRMTQQRRRAVRPVRSHRTKQPTSGAVGLSTSYVSNEGHAGPVASAGAQHRERAYRADDVAAAGGGGSSAAGAGAGAAAGAGAGGGTGEGGFSLGARLPRVKRPRSNPKLSLSPAVAAKKRRKGSTARLRDVAQVVGDLDVVALADDCSVSGSSFTSAESETASGDEALGEEDVSLSLAGVVSDSSEFNSDSENSDSDGERSIQPGSRPLARTASASIEVVDLVSGEDNDSSRESGSGTAPVLAGVGDTVPKPPVGFQAITTTGMRHVEAVCVFCTTRVGTSPEARHSHAADCDKWPRGLRRDRVDSYFQEAPVQLRCTSCGATVVDADGSLAAHRADCLMV